MWAIQADIALTLLLGIIKRVGMEKRPHKLAADIFQTKFEMGMLIDSVVAAVKRARTDIEALLVGDFFRTDKSRCVTRARGSDSGIEWMSKRIAQRYVGRRGLNEFSGARAFEHARLISHGGRLFYTDGESEHTQTHGMSLQNE